MKFVHVSFLFTVSSPLFGVEATPTPLTGWEEYGDIRKGKRESGVDKYLKSVFPNKFEGEKLENVKKRWNEFHITETVLVDSEGIYCDAPGTDPHRNVRALLQKSPNQNGAKKKAGTVARAPEHDEQWCCSGKVSDVTTIDKTKGRCACKPKGAKVEYNAGLSCCSQYAVLQDGVPVCGGIPPYGVNQPLITPEQTTGDGNLLILRESDCMFPLSGSVQEDSKRLKHPNWQWGSDFFVNAKACGPRKCQRRGENTTAERDICCAGTAQDKLWRRDAPDKGTPCGCGHYKSVLSEYTTASEADCCSGMFGGDIPRTCTCIPPFKERPPDALDTDCCTGGTTHRSGKHWCMAPDCTDQGKVIVENAHHCCVKKTLPDKKYDLGKKCGCVPGGTIEKDGLAEHCCSRQFQADDKTCDWIPPEGPVQDWFDETECYSQKAKVSEDTDLKLCTCIAPFSTVRDPDVLKFHPEYCCSKYIINDTSSNHNGFCGCIKDGDNLGHGSDETHCCSGKAEDGVCTCVPPGGRFSKAEGMTASDCCSGLATENFCRCSPTTDITSTRTLGKNLTNIFWWRMAPELVVNRFYTSRFVHPPTACCGEDGTEKTCPCIPDGHLVPTSERADPNKVCCTKIGSSKCVKTRGEWSRNLTKVGHP